MGPGKGERAFPWKKSQKKKPTGLIAFPLSISPPLATCLLLSFSGLGKRAVDGMVCMYSGCVMKIVDWVVWMIGEEH